MLEAHPEYSKAAARHGADRALDCLRAVEVPDGLGLGSQQPEVLPAARAAALECAHGGLRPLGRRWLASLVRDHRVRCSTAGCRAWAGRPAARPWCTGSASRSAGSRSRRGTRRTTSAARWSRISRCSASMLFRDWGAKFYFNALIAAAVALIAWLLPAARTRRSRAACRRSRSTRTTIRRATAKPASRRSPFREIFFKYVLPQPLPVGDRGRQRLLLFRPLRRRELDSDLPRRRPRGFRSSSRASAGRSTSSPRSPGRSPAAGSRTAGSRAGARR